MPTMQAWIDVALTATAAVLVGVAAALRLWRVRLLAAVAIVVASAVGLYFLSVITWRLHAPGSAGSL
jgi:hypothetical protein